MPSNFDLIITADYPSRTAELRLLDEHGVQLAFRQTDFKTIAVSRQQGLFDLRNYLCYYVEPGREAASVAEIGVCIAEEVLGADIFRALAASVSQRTLRIQLPGASAADNHLAAALARVPWEMARAAIEAGGFIPRLFFLSACHSGDILRVEDWNDFLAVAQGKAAPGTKHTPASDTRDVALDERPGYTGTAHALLQGGVPSVIAMRYAVGDDYARELAVAFYRTLLAHAQPKTAAAALTMARQALRDPNQPGYALYDICDHATPVLYGAEHPGLTVQQGRSPGLDTRHPRLHQIAELTTVEHAHFVGRTWELAGLGADFIGSSSGAEVKPVALITGLGGMGKTALAAEALALWESQFEWVLLYQAKPNALGFDATLRDIHTKLYAELGRYHAHVQSRPADAIYRAADPEFTGAERLERLTRNLVRALRDEPILLVLDNFETNLKPQAEPGTAAEPLWACQDPAWDRCLTPLAAELVGTPSRALITCRWPLAAVAGTACPHILLGPLPAGEAALYLREHAGLSKMMFSSDTAERALARRLINASRFHPLLMDRLARLATGGPALRPQLLQVLEALETRHDYAQLPALFATSPGEAQELAYLNDALATSLDQIIRDASPDARRLLWMIAVANEPVTLSLLRSVWSAAPTRPDPTAAAPPGGRGPGHGGALEAGRCQYRPHLPRAGARVHPRLDARLPAGPG